jgi:hypothetical protein
MRREYTMAGKKYEKYILTELKLAEETKKLDETI